MQCPLCKRDFNPVDELGEPVLLKIGVGEAAIETKVVPCYDCFEKTNKLVAEYGNALVAQLAEALGREPRG